MKYYNLVMILLLFLGMPIMYPLLKNFKNVA